jgi:hypothetical protein
MDAKIEDETKEKGSMSKREENSEGGRRVG